MLEIAFRFRHGCDVGKLSEAHPDVLIAQWCNRGVEVVEIHARGAKLEEVMASLRTLSKRGLKPLRESVEGGDSQLLLLRCPHRGPESIDKIIESAGCLYLPPVVYRDGWEHYRTIAFDEDTARELVKAMKGHGEFELISKRPIGGGLTTRALVITASQLLSELTAKQASAMLGAIEEGYYRVPRKVRTEDIARRRKVPRTTFEEHVRKAEAKIMQSMAPYVALYVGDEKGSGKA